MQLQLFRPLAVSSCESNSAAAVASAFAGLPTPPVIDYTATLRALNKQHLHAYIDVLSVLTSAAPASTAGNSAASSDAASSVAVEADLKCVSDTSAIGARSDAQHLAPLPPQEDLIVDPSRRLSDDASPLRHPVRRADRLGGTEHRRDDCAAQQKKLCPSSS